MKNSSGEVRFIPASEEAEMRSQGWVLTTEVINPAGGPADPNPPPAGPTVDISDRGAGLPNLKALMQSFAGLNMSPEEQLRRIEAALQGGDYVSGVPVTVGQGESETLIGYDRLTQAELDAENAAARREEARLRGDSIFDFGGGDTSDGGGGGGGRGSGRVAPVYVAPDRRDVEEQVRSLLINMVGGQGVTEQRIKTLTDHYLRVNRSNFDNPNSQVSVRQDLKDQIRRYSDFQAIHQLRPESIDEESWVSSYAGQVAAAGLNVTDIDQVAAQLATVGATGEGVNNNVEARLLSQGQRPLGIVKRFRDASANAARLIR